MHQLQRREFLKQLAAAAGGVVLVPSVSFVSEARAQESQPTKKIPPVPAAPPEGWDPIAYNRERGNAGAIPQSYHASINGPEGPKKHLGKHLPYVPKVDPKLVPAGFLALMWGDPAKGHARHPNAPKNESNNNEGHWYNWIRVCKVGTKDEVQSTYTDWPQVGPDSNGAYAVSDGGDIAADGGRNTVYLAALPPGVQKGDTLRVYAHCLTHGEWVDFLTV